jgi:MFS family permease
LDVPQLNWVCEDNWKPATGQSLFFIGSVFGSLGLGVMADHIGRLPVLVLSNILALLGNVATSFTHQLPEFAASRLLAGLAVDTNFFMMYIIGENRASWGGTSVLFLSAGSLP